MNPAGENARIQPAENLLAAVCLPIFVARWFSDKWQTVYGTRSFPLNHYWLASSFYPVATMLLGNCRLQVVIIQTLGWFLVQIFQVSKWIWMSFNFSSSEMQNNGNHPNPPPFTTPYFTTIWITHPVIPSGSPKIRWCCGAQHIRPSVARKSTQPGKWLGRVIYAPTTHSSGGGKNIAFYVAFQFSPHMI